MWLSTILLIGGLALLFVGAETLVRASVALAERLGLSKLIIGLTVVGFGTSTPELLVSISAALRGAPELALGNVVGSNTANVLLIIGIAALVQPLSAWPRSALRDCLVAALVALALFGLVHGTTIGRFDGSVMFAALIAYLIVSYKLERRENARPIAELETEEFEDIAIPRTWLAPVLIAVGIATLVAGAANRPTSFPRSSSSDGNAASALTPSGSRLVRPIAPPRMTKFSLVLAKSAATLGAATGSFE